MHLYLFLSIQKYKCHLGKRRQTLPIWALGPSLTCHHGNQEAKILSLYCNIRNCSKWLFYEINSVKTSCPLSIQTTQETLLSFSLALALWKQSVPAKTYWVAYDIATYFYTTYLTSSRIMGTQAHDINNILLIIYFKSISTLFICWNILCVTASVRNVISSSD